MLTLLGILALAIAVSGALALLASRQMEAVEPDREQSEASGSGGRVAALVDDGLRRTGQAVDVLVDPFHDVEEPRAQEPPFEDRRATYAVMGAGLLGLALVLGIGVALVLAG